MEESDKNINEISLKASECPIRRVTVYTSGAEVCRELETVVKAGVSEIHITEFVSIEENSLRVEGKGKVTVTEVSFRRMYVTEDEVTTTEKVKQLKEELNKLLEEEIALDYETQKLLLAKQWKMLDNYAAAASKYGQADGIKHEVKKRNFKLDSAFITGMREFMQLYKDIAKKLEADRLNLDKKKKDLAKKIDVVKSNLQIQDNSCGRHEKRECLIILEAEEETRVQLSAYYVVLEANWKAIYDLRMVTYQDILKIHYYGLISQKSGEDWNDVKLFLSTAKPSISGNIPPLPSLELIRIEEPKIKTDYLTPCLECLFCGIMLSAEEVLFDCRWLTSEVFAESSEGENSNSQPALGAPKVQVKEGMTSTTYEIVRLSTIPSDNTEHKVAVALIDLKPTLTYLTVPKVIPDAFLQAKVTNTSQYTLLAGRTNVFLNSSFVGKAEIKAVAPQEEFECSLGVDPGIRVDYKPLVVTTSLTGPYSNTQCITNEQTIVIKNMHDYSVKVTVRDNLPRSLTEKITVKLISPDIDIKHPENTEGVRLTKSNNVEWDLDIEGLCKTVVVFKYTVEHPANEKVKLMLSYEK